MKSILTTLLATASLAATGFASTHIALDTTATDIHNAKSPVVIGQFHSVTSETKPATTKIGDFVYSVTPTLSRGAVNLAVVVTHQSAGGKAHTFGPFRHNQKPGVPLKLSVGTLYFSTRATVMR